MTGPDRGRRQAAFALVFGLLALTSARADAVDPATRDALQSVVTRQLAALDRGDGAAAEAFAAPGIRDKFPDPAGFLAMVRTNYAALIKPRSTRFTGVETSPHGPLVTLSIVGADGKVWTAVYSFEKTGDEWRITGCGLQEDKNQQAI